MQRMKNATRAIDVNNILPYQQISDSLLIGSNGGNASNDKTLISDSYFSALCDLNIANLSIVNNWRVSSKIPLPHPYNANEIGEDLRY